MQGEVLPLEIVDHPRQSFNNVAGAIDAKIDRAKGVYQQTGSLGIAAGDVTNINQLAEGIFNARVLGPPQAVGTGWARFNAVGNGTVGALNTATAVGGAATGAISVGNSFLQCVEEAGGLGVTWRKGMAINPFARSTQAASTANELVTLPNGDVRFRGMTVQVQEDLTHVPTQALEDMAAYGISPFTENDELITLHHVKQNPSGPLWEIPGPLNDIHNKELHPFGNSPGAGLTSEQRAAFDDWRTAYWKARAREELARRNLGSTGGR